MTEQHDIFVRAYAVPVDDKTKPRRPSGDGQKWPGHALVIDTETRITADQSLTFGVFRLCKLDDNQYKLAREGLFYAAIFQRRIATFWRTTRERRYRMRRPSRRNSRFMRVPTSCARCFGLPSNDTAR